MEHLGYNDKPILRLKDDLFQVDKYVKGLCKFILECETPMTVSIQGDWGSGKTSMMNMIQDKLGDKVLPIWFNTWQFSQFNLGNSLAISMLEVLLNKLGGDTKVLDKLAGGILNALEISALASVEVSAGSMMKDKLKNFLDSYGEKSCIQEITELKAKFEGVIAAKIKPPIKRVVVFVDDLDRLEPAKAIELLEVLKLFLDCKNCVFVLAVDYEVVTLGIRQKYGSDINAAKGKSFFDKIIQLPFKIPVAQYDIKKYVNSMMSRMKINDTTNIEMFSSLIRTSVGLNPRGMKRLFNTYQLIYNILPDEIAANNFKQRILFAVVCMQMSFGAIYDYLSDGNLDADTLKNLADVNEKSVNKFLKQRALAETGNADILSEDILSAVFGSKISTEELRETLQKLPAFIKQFISAISATGSEKLSEKEIRYLREILDSSAIVDVKSEVKSEAEQKAVELRQKNRERAQKINKLLADKHHGEFRTIQDTRSNDGIISTLAAGFRIYTSSGKKYQLRYVIDCAPEDKIALSIFLNGYEQNPQDFYKLMGDNPLGYEKPLPDINSVPGWYFYDNVLVAEANDDFVELTAKEVERAYNKLKEKLGDLE